MSAFKSILLHRNRLIRLAAVALAIVVVLAIGLRSLWNRLPALTVIPDGCEVMHPTEARCELYEGRRTVRLWIDTKGDARVRILEGIRAVPFVTLQTDQGRLLEIVPGAGTHTYTILASRGIDLSRARLSFVDWQVADWLLAARRAYEGNNDAEALRILKERENDPASPAARTQASSLRAKIEYQAGHLEAAEQWFARAIDEARTAGLPSREAQDTLWRARVLGQMLRRFNDAEKLLENCKAFDQLPDLLVWRYLQVALYRLMRGDIRGAMPALEETARWAFRFHNEFAIPEVAMRRADLHLLLGRPTQAQAELDRIADVVLPVCRSVIVVQNRGLLRLERLALQSGSGTLRSEDDPRPLLEKALEIRRRDCTQKREIANLLVSLGEAALLLGDRDGATRRLAELRAEGIAEDPALRAQSLKLEGQIQLAAAQWNDAEKTFGRLFDLLRRGDPSDDLMELFWYAWLGLAQSYEGQERIPDALDAYREAERYLDRRAREIPLDGRSGFLGRHERGTALYVDLLVRRGATEPKLLDEALRAVRRARIRGILALGGLVDSARRTDEEREAMRRALVEYRAKRLEVEKLRTLAADADRTEENRLLAQTEAQEKSLISLLPAALGLLGQDETTAPFRSPGPDELLLACHPIRANWICFAATTDSVQPITIPPPDGTLATKAMLEKQLLPPLAQLFSQKKRLSFIAYGQMRDVGIESLSLKDRPLEADHEIVWTLDMPGPAKESRPSSLSPRALLVSDLGGEIGTEGTADNIISTLRATERWTLERHVGRPPWENKQPNTSMSSLIPLGIDLSASMEGTDLFIYFGHGESKPGKPLQHGLIAGPITLLSVSDALLLSAPPRRAVFVACESGIAPIESGGVEGIGLAQALLLRGSQLAIAATKKIDIKTGRILLGALFGAGMEKPDGDPVQALRAARQMVRAEWIKGGGAPDDPRLRDLEAVHVFVR